MTVWDSQNIPSGSRKCPTSTNTTNIYTHKDSKERVTRAHDEAHLLSANGCHQSSRADYMGITVKPRVPGAVRSSCKSNFFDGGLHTLEAQYFHYDFLQYGQFLVNLCDVF